MVIEGSVDPELVSLALAEAGLAGRSTGVVLRPRVEVALERNAAEGRKSFDTTVLEPAIRRIGADLAGQATGAGWTVIDNSDEPVAATVARILQSWGPLSGRRPVLQRRA